MRLVDTSAWIEWLLDSSVGKSVGAELPDNVEWLVPTIVQLELAKWLTREMGENTADQVIAFTRTCIVSNLDTAIALAAADLCARHRLPMADAIIYATARANDAHLVTCDKHFEGLPNVRFIPKYNA
jgi:predicted nucleic acid-binding protein